MLTENASLREEIDSFRVERTRYENIRKKLDKVRRALNESINNWIYIALNTKIPSLSALNI